MKVPIKYKKLVCGCGVLLLAGCEASSTSNDGAATGSVDESLAVPFDDPTAPPVYQPPPAPVAVTSVELGKAYDENEAAAQLKYGKSRLLVSGTVTAITLDYLDKPVVKMPGIDLFSDVSLELAEEAQPKAADLKKGQRLVLLCDSVGEIMGSPMVSECTFPVETGAASKDEGN